MKRNMMKTFVAALVVGSILIFAGNMVFADTSTNTAGSELKAPNGSMPPGGGGIESILEKAVSDKTITQETADKIKAYLQETEEVRKNEFDNMQNLSEEERKAYMEQHQQEKKDLFEQLIAAGILTQSQGDALSKMLPANDGQMSKPSQQQQQQPQNSDNQSMIKVKINGAEKSFSPAPVNKEGSVLVPMRSFFEALGCEINWDDATKTVIGQKSGTQIKLTINQESAYVNNEIKSLSSAAQIINGSTYVPLRFVGEALGADVDWKDGVITISTN